MSDPSPLVKGHHKRVSYVKFRDICELQCMICSQYKCWSWFLSDRVHGVDHEINQTFHYRIYFGIFICKCHHLRITLWFSSSHKTICCIRVILVLKNMGATSGFNTCIYNMGVSYDLIEIYVFKFSTIWARMYCFYLFMGILKEHDMD